MPSLPKTTFNVGVVSGGTSVNTISGSASFLVDLRSDSGSELERLAEELLRAVDRAVEEILAILIAEGCRKERRLHLIEGV